MKTSFKYDLCVIDTETTGLDLSVHEVIEIGAVLLDKKTFKPKREFKTFVKPKAWANRLPEAMAVNGITWEQVKKAPVWPVAYQKLLDWAAGPVIVVTFNGWFDMAVFRQECQRSGLDFKFDYHWFDIWSLCLTYMQEAGKLTNKLKFHGFGLEDVAREFRIASPKARHRALVDARLTGEVFSKLIKNLKWQK